MNEIEPLPLPYPANVIPWPVFLMKQMDRQIQKAFGLTPEMLRSIDSGRASK